MTGVNASKLAIAAFIIPYIFVLNPEILMIDSTPAGLIITTVTAILGMIGISSAMIGYLAGHSNVIERIVQFIAGLLMIIPGVTTDIPGFIILVAIIIWQRKNKKN